jgi:hypothetical protein
LIIGFDAKSATAISKCKNLSLDLYKHLPLQKVQFSK